MHSAEILSEQCFRKILQEECGSEMENENSEGEETRERVILIVKCKIMRNLGDGGRKGKMLERGF